MLTPLALHNALQRAHAVNGATILTAPEGPVALMVFRASADAEIAEKVANDLYAMGVPTVAIALDDAGCLDRVHQVAARLPVPVLSDPYGTWRRKLGLNADACLLMATETGSARFELHRSSRRATFAVIFDDCWRDLRAAG